MRIFLNPRAVLSVVVAAAATPFIVKNAKPIAKKLGKKFEEFGQKLNESVTKMEEAEAAKAAEEPHRHGPGATPESTPDEAPKPEEGAETHVPDPTEVPAEPTAPATTETPDPTEIPQQAPTEVPPGVTQPDAPKASTKVKSTKPAPKKKATKTSAKTVKAKRTTGRRATRDIGETG